MAYHREHNFRGVICFNKSIMSVLHDERKTPIDKPIQIVLAKSTVMKNNTDQKTQSAKLRM